MTAALGALKPPPGIKLMQSWHPNDGNCCWQMAAVDPFGRSIGCSYLREFVDYGDVREDGILPTWDHPLYRELRYGEVERSCGTCAGTRSEEPTSELQSLMRRSYADFCLPKTHKN